MVAGVLLLIKHKLSILSPAGSDEAPIKTRILPKADSSGEITWVGEGTKTIDVQQMRERRMALGISVDWVRIEKIVKHRNDVEHAFPTVTQAALRTLIADTFVVIRDFLRGVLGVDPFAALGGPTWSMTNQNDLNVLLPSTWQPAA